MDGFETVDRIKWTARKYYIKTETMYANVEFSQCAILLRLQ